MKSNFKSMIAGVIAVCICITMTGCGDSKPKNEEELESMLENMPEDEMEKKIEKAAESMDCASWGAVEVGTTEETVPEIVYEPTDEILNADFSSGLVQIGNDVFRNGGYYTVDQFIAEFGDRYDMSEVSPDGFVQTDAIWKTGSFQIVSLDDPELKVTVCYDSRNVETDDVKIRIGDTMVAYVSAQVGKENCWYPKGIKCTAEGYEYNDISAFLEENGYINVPGDEVGFDYYRNYGMYWEEFSDFGHIVFRDRGSKENILGLYPILEYEFTFKPETAEILSFGNNGIIYRNSSGIDLDEYTPIDKNVS